MVHSDKTTHAVPAEPLPSNTATPASRLGLMLFGIYLAFYVAFVLISALASDWMEIVLPGGLNLAVVYGFGLIALALLLAVVYGGARQRN